jgi:hypothetical protein
MTTRLFTRLVGGLGVLFLALAAGCGGGSDSPPAVGGLTVSELAGAWLTGCETESGNGSVSSRLTAVGISTGGDVDFCEYQWTSGGCDGDVALFARNVGTLTLPGGEVSTGFGAATRADLTATEQWVTVFDPDLVGQFNAENDEDGAYCLGPWEQGVAQNVTGIDYNCGPGGTVMKTLFLRSGETLFVGDEDTIDESGYPTEVQAGVARVSAAPVTATALQGEWSAPCGEDYHSDFAAQTSLSWIDVTGNTLVLATTYYDSFDGTSCDTNGTAMPMARESLTLTFAMQPGATLLTERGMATPGDFSLTGHTLTPLDATVADNLNLANFGDGAYNYNDWAADVPVDVFAQGVEYDGSPQVTAMKVAALIRGDAFFIRGGESPTQVPQDDAGYPLAVGTGAFLRNHAIASAADLAGNWFEPCRNSEGWMTSAIMVSGSTATRKEWGYLDESTCRGALGWSSSTAYAMSPQGSVNTDRGTAYQVQLQPEVGNPYCILLMRIGDRLYGTDPAPASGPTCDPGEYAVEVSDGFSSREVTPVTTTPLSTFQGTCRQEEEEDWRDFYRFLGGAISVTTLHFDPLSACTGQVNLEEQFSGRLAFGALATVPEGKATRIVLTSQTGETLKQVFKWMAELFWFGDETGPMQDGYPTTLIPGQGAVRTY